MKHESGIEVYLIPADGDGDSLKYPELHRKQKLAWHDGMFGTKETEVQYQARHNCCFVRRHENQRFKIVLRFNEGFDMYSSSSILIGVGVGANQRYKWYPARAYQSADNNSRLRHDRWIEGSRFEYHSVQKSFAVGQQIVLEGPNGSGYTLSEYEESEPIEYDENSYWEIRKYPRSDCANPGTLTVVVQRGGHDWLDEDGKPRKEQSKIGPDGPLKERPRKEKSFKHVYSKNGRKIRWEFRVRSLDRMLEIEKRNREADGQPPMNQQELNDPLRYTLIRDEDFELKGRQGQDYRLQLQDEYLKKVERVKKPAKPRRVRKQPQVCNCPKEHDGTSCRKRKALNEAIEDDDTDCPTPKAKKSRMSHTSSQVDEQASDSSVPPEDPSTPTTGEQDALLAPRACNKCRKYKKAPKNKKWFYVTESGRWMLAPIGADDSFQPLPDGEEADEETIQRAAATGPGQAPGLAAPRQPILRPDRDDEEIVGIEAKPAESETPIAEADVETVQQVTGAEQHLEPTTPAIQQPLFQQYENDQEIANTNETRETQGTPNMTAVGLTGASPAYEPVHAALNEDQEVDQADPGTMQDIVPTAEVPSTDLPAVPEPPSTSKSIPSRIWTPLKFTLHLYDGNSAAKTNNGANEQRPDRVGGRLRQISGNSNPPTPSPRLPSTERYVWDDPLERRSESSLAVSSTPRVKPEPHSSIGQSGNVVDLTGDSSSEIRAFKKEYSEQVESKYQHTNVVQKDTEDEVEAELRRIRLRREEIQLERRQAELEEKLKQMAAAKQRIKVKQEIIEID